MGYLIVDLETQRDRSLPERSSEDFPPPTYHQIVCVGVGYVSIERPVVKLSAFVGDERCILGRFVSGSAFDEPERSHQRQAPGHTLVTFNGRRFDVPVLVARCMRQGLAWPWYWRERAARIRYSSDAHLDLSDELTDFGAAQPCGLDAWSRCIGQVGKNGDGASVEGLAAAKEWDRIGRYCVQDVRLTAALLLRWLLVRGRVSGAQEAELLAMLRDAEPEIAVLGG